MDFTNDFFIQAQGVIERVCRAERQRLLDAYGKIESEQKSDNTPVTELDKSMETKFRQALKDFDSGIGLQGEEQPPEGNRDTFWLIDPIDGTNAFIRGGEAFRNVVTLITDGRPYFTLVYKPVHDHLYVAAEGEGAYLNGRAIHLKERPLKRSRLAVHSPSRKTAVWAMMTQLSQHVDGLETYADFVKVATGELDGLLIYNGGGGPWDFAPRALLLQEAGAKVSNLGTESYDYRQNNLLAAHPANYEKLMKLITDIAATL